MKLGTDVIWVSSQWYVGDDANQNVKLADYWVANLHGSYQFTKELQIYGVINNLFNRKFATFGTYFNPQSIVNVLPIRRPTPAPSRRRSRSRSMSVCARSCDEGVLPRFAAVLSSPTYIETQSHKLLGRGKRVICRGVGLGVKLRRIQPEHISPALPPLATLEPTWPIGSFVPTNETRSRGSALRAKAGASDARMQ